MANAEDFQVVLDGLHIIATDAERDAARAALGRIEVSALKAALAQADSVNVTRRAKTAMLGEVAMALLADRETTAQRHQWAPVLKRIEEKYEASNG